MKMATAVTDGTTAWRGIFERFGLPWPEPDAEMRLRVGFSAAKFLFVEEVRPLPARGRFLVTFGGERGLRATGCWTGKSWIWRAWSAP